MKSYKVQGTKGQYVITIPMYECNVLGIKAGMEMTWDRRGSDLVLRKKVV